MQRLPVMAIIGAGLFAASLAFADNWDLQTANCPDCGDNAAFETTTELIHGSDQLHDLQYGFPDGTNDQDWYFVSIKPYSSYEVWLDSTTPFMNASNAVDLELVTDTGTAVLGPQNISSRHFSRSLRFRNDTATTIDDRWVRVVAPDCGGVCDARDSYRVHMNETTYFIPRYNNSASQVTVLVLQNPTDDPVTAKVYFWSSTGSLVTTSTLSMAARSTTTLNTSSVAAGSSGSITIANDAPYGSLAGKAVALEGTTGFTFDTTMVPRFK